MKSVILFAARSHLSYVLDKIKDAPKMFRAIQVATGFIYFI